MCKSEEGHCCYCRADSEEKAWMAVYERIACHCFELCKRARPDYFELRDEERAYIGFAAPPVME